MSPCALTPPELRVLRLLAEGQRRRDMARATRYSEEGIKNILRRIYQRLGAANAPHAVHLAHERGLLGATAGAWHAGEW